MHTQMTADQLRAMMTKAKATWTINSRLNHANPVPGYALGADLSKVPNSPNEKS